MKLSSGRALLVLGATLFTCLSAARGASSGNAATVGDTLRSATLDGTWSGTTRCLYDPGLWPDDVCDSGWNISIDGSSATIEMITRDRKGKETRSRVEDRPIFVRRFETNAVLTTIEGGNDEDGHWVETWTFSLSLEDKDHVLAHWNRVVNNTDLPLDKKGSKFSVVQMGELVRSAPPAVHAPDTGEGPGNAAALAALLLASPQWRVAQKKLEGVPDLLSAELRKQFASRKLNEAQQGAVDDAAREVVDVGRELSDPKEVMALIRDVVLHTYTDSEIKAVLAFQSSNEGRSISAKDVLVQQEVAKKMQERVARYLPRMKVIADSAKTRVGELETK